MRGEPRASLTTSFVPRAWWLGQSRREAIAQLTWSVLGLTITLSWRAFAWRYCRGKGRGTGNETFRKVRPARRFFQTRLLTQVWKGRLMGSRAALGASRGGAGCPGGRARDKAARFELAQLKSGLYERDPGVSWESFVFPRRCPLAQVCQPADTNHRPSLSLGVAWAWKDQISVYIS